jgi:hypothetical protein
MSRGSSAMNTRTSDGSFSTTTPAGSTFDGRIFNLWPRNNAGTFKTYIRSNAPVAHNSAMYKYRQHQCRPDNETDLVGCFAEQDKCTIGYAGFRATVNYAVKGLELRTAAGGASTGPTDTSNYPLARNLYVCQLDNPGSSVGAQSAGYVNDQKTFYNDIGTQVHERIDQAVSEQGFLPLPAFEKTCCFGAYDPATGLCM